MAHRGIGSLVILSLILTVRARQWRKTKEKQSCFDVVEAGRVDIHGDECVGSSTRLLQST